MARWQDGSQPAIVAYADGDAGNGVSRGSEKTVVSAMLVAVKRLEILSGVLRICRRGAAARSLMPGCWRVCLACLAGAASRGKSLASTSGL